MTDLAEVLSLILLIGGPIIIVLGIVVAVWSAFRTRRRYYDEFMRNRDK